MEAPEPILRIQSPERLRETWTEVEAKGEWSAAYQSLRQRAEEQEHRLKLRSKDARAPANRAKNRYRDVLPYDHSRIRLSRADDYINASLVPVPAASRRYILCQGPLQSTADQFWAMVWEQRSPLICMLNRVVEKNQEKCFLYYPTSLGERLDFEGPFSVRLDEEEIGENFTRRSLSLSRGAEEAAESRTVEHFQFTTWPDFGVPAEPCHILQYLSEVRRSGLLDASAHGAAVVHCSAGIGRSGTFIILDTSLNLLAARASAEERRRQARREKEDEREVEETATEEAEIEEERPPPHHRKELDITALAVELRRYRMGLIQTREQLEFTWRAVMEALEDGRWAELLRPLELCESPELRRSCGNAHSEGLHSLSIDHSLVEARAGRKRANTAGPESPAPAKFSSLATVTDPPSDLVGLLQEEGATQRRREREAKKREEMAGRLAEMKARLRASERRGGGLGWNDGWSRLVRENGRSLLIATAAAAAAALLYHFCT